VTEHTEHGAAIDTVIDEPIVGILGGMGPLATADFYMKLIASTPATRDQEHLRVVMWADPTVPDRSTGLLGNGADATPWLVRGGQMLAAMGASFIAMPCNTAHAYLPRVQPQVAIPFLHMMDEAATAVEIRYPLVERVGLLATTATIERGLYAEWFARHHIEVAVPDAARQALVMEAIAAVKAGDSMGDSTARSRGAAATAQVREAADYLVTHRAELLVLGCTELPLIFRERDAPIRVLDPTQILAEAVVRKAGRVPQSSHIATQEAAHD